MQSHQYERYMLHNFSKQKGFSLIEFVIYIAIVAFVVVFSMNSLFSMRASSATLRTARYRDSAVVQGFDTIERRVRNASSVVVASSTLGVHPGVLALSTGSQIYLSGGALMEREFPSLVGATVTPSNALISRFVVQRIPTTVSDGVKVEMTVDGVEYQTTIVTRNRR